MRNLTANLLDLTRAAVDELVAHFPGAHVVADTAPLCAVRGSKPHAATDGRLCREHLDELGTWLRDIEREVATLDARPSMSTRWGDSTSGGTLASQQAPVVLDAIAYADTRSTAHGHRHPGPVCRRCPTLVGRRCSCPPGPTRRREVHWDGCPRRPAHPSCLAILADRDEHEANAERIVSVVGVLHDMAQRVREERMIKPPVAHLIDRVPAGYTGPYTVARNGVVGVARKAPALPTVLSERELLTRQLDWIAGQPWVMTMRAQLAELRRGLLRVNRNDDHRPIEGWCFRLVQGEECGGTLRSVEPVHSTGYESSEGHRAIECSRNSKHRWEGVALASLSVVLEQQRKERRRKGTAS